MNWWGRLLHRGRLENQLDKELRFHLDQYTSDLIAGGLNPAEARRQANIAFGGPEQVKEECRDARGTRWLEDLAQDVRFAVRTLRQRPGFAAVALITLALGIGATTVMFTLVDTVLLKPLPFPDPSRLLAIHGRSATWNVALYGEQNLAYPDFLDARAQVRSVRMTGFVFNTTTLSAPGEPEHVEWAEAVSGLFSTFGLPMASGREFDSSEDSPAGAPAAILGYSLWQRHFAGNPVIGTSVVIDGKHYTVVGIAPRGFHIFDEEPDVYTPLAQDTQAFLKRRGPHPVTTFARLLPAATLAQAQSELGIIAKRLARQFPATNGERTLTTEPLRARVGDVRSTLWLLLGAVTLVLLIACANVASLLLARAVSRERELAMRVALGAGRARLVRQCLTESAVLGVAGGVLGTGLAALGLRPFVAFWPGDLPRATEIHLDLTVLFFALAVSLCCGVLFGIAPALRVPVHNVEGVLRSGSRTLAGASRRLHGGFVIAEIALAVVLLVSAGTLGRTLVQLSSLDPGLDTRNVLTARLALSPAVLASPARIPAAWDEVLANARAVPGVVAVAAVDTVPMRQGNNPLGYWTTPDIPPDNKQPLALTTSVTPDYLNVTGIPLREGRFIAPQDRLETQPVIVIDDIMARHAFPGRDPVGRQLWVPAMGKDPFTIVGVVGHVRYWGLAGDDQAAVRDQLYYPFAQVPAPLLRRWSELMSIAVRTSVPPLGIVEPLRRAIRGAGSDQVIYQIRTLEGLAAASLERQRFLLLLFGVFSGLALLLASIGIYGVLAYLTSRRTPEIGVRMAMGATGSDVVRMVLRQSLVMILTGAVLGLAGSLAAERLLVRLVEGMRPTGPVTFAGMTAILIAAALCASFVPARRASRVDPVNALRQE